MRAFVRPSVLLMVWMVGAGCAGEVFAAEGVARHKAAAADVPRELALRPLPTYTIEPPDILQIEITVSKGSPISANPIPTPGAVAVDRASRPVSVAHATGQRAAAGLGQTVVTATTVYGGAKGSNDASLTTWGTVDSVKPNQPGAQAAVKTRGPAANAATELIAGTVQTGKSDSMVAGAHPASGQYLVGPDGTVNFGRYGRVQVLGTTVEEAAAAVRKQLSKYLASPDVSVQVIAYNSKVYYIITEGAGLGDNIRRVPITGKETVLDALGVVNGLSQVSSTRIWIARPSPSNSTNGTILPVDYAGITQRAATATNYQIMPGDRLFIAEDRTTAVNNWITKKSAPIERVLGLISLGASTIESVERLLPDPPKYPPGTTVPGQ